MGVKGLFTFIKKAPGLIKTFSLSNSRRRNSNRIPNTKRNIIVIDGSAFLKRFFVYKTAYDYENIFKSIETFIQCLIKNNFKIVFIFDGMTKNDWILKTHNRHKIKMKRENSRINRFYKFSKYFQTFHSKLNSNSILNTNKFIKGDLTLMNLNYTTIHISIIHYLKKQYFESIDIIFGDLETDCTVKCAKIECTFIFLCFYVRMTQSVL